MIINLIRILTFLVIILVANVSIAEIYRYVDNNGIEHFTDDVSKVPAQNRNHKKSDAEINTPLSSKVAPYTVESKNRINKIQQEMPFKLSSKNISTEEGMRELINYIRKVYNKAGYDYDATIRSISNDFKNHLERIPKDEVTIVNEIVMGIKVMKSQSDYEGVDCYDFFDEKTADALRFITGDKKAVKGEVAPYTKDAKYKIERAISNMERRFPDLSKMQNNEICKQAINVYRKVFASAGYDYDATTTQIARDLNNKGITIDSDTVVSYVIDGLKSFNKRNNCFSNNNDKIFDDTTFESVRVIIGK